MKKRIRQSTVRQTKLNKKLAREHGNEFSVAMRNLLPLYETQEIKLLKREFEAQVSN